MDLSKNYVLKFLRESQESDFTNDAPLESVQNVSEQTQGWSFTEHDMAFSECPTYVYSGEVQCINLGGDGTLDPMDVNPKLNVMSPDLESLLGQSGVLTLIYCKSIADTPNEDEDEFGFEIDIFNDSDDHMIYGYAKNLEEFKSLMSDVVSNYFDLPSDIPYEEFAQKVQELQQPAAQEDSSEPVGESDTSEAIQKILDFPVNKPARFPMHLEKDLDFIHKKVPQMKKEFRIAEINRTIRRPSNMPYMTIRKGDIFIVQDSLYDYFAYKFDTEDEQWEPVGNYLGNDQSYNVFEPIQDFYEYTSPISEKDARELISKAQKSEGIVDDIKSDIKNSKTLKSVQAGLEKIKERFNKTIQAAKALFSGKQYVYTYKANGNATFSLKGELEAEADNGEWVYIDHKMLFGSGRQNEWESPYWDVEQDFLNGEPAENLYEEEDLAEYLDESLKKDIVSIKFKGFPSLTGYDGGFMHEWTIVAKKQLSDEQIAELKSYMDGQMSDGLGEGFEQHPIDTTMEIWEDGVEIPNPDYDPNAYSDDDDEDEEDEDTNPEFYHFSTIHENANIEVYIHLWCQKDFSSKIEFDREELKQ